jgi:hypothetical protein
LAASAGAQTIIYERSDPVVVYPANEVYQARVLSASAAKDVPQERCRIERQQVDWLELPSAIVGGTVDRFAGRQSTLRVQRCKTFAGGAAYWDVAYEFRRVERPAEINAIDTMTEQPERDPGRG